MLPLLGGLAPLITGGASLLGSIFSSQTSAANTQAQIGAQEQMQASSEQFNSNEAATARNWQEQMSNTAYQRATNDMKAAGLNPMMMFGSGSAAGTPGGSTASIGTPNVPMPQRTNPLAGVGDAVKSATASAVQQAQIGLLTEEAAKAKVDATLTQRTVDVDQPSGQRQLTDAETARAAAAARSSTQEQVIRSFEEKTGKVFSSLPDSVQNALVTGKAVLNTAGEVVSIGAGLGIGRALFNSGSSAAAPRVASPVNVPAPASSATGTRSAMKSLEDIGMKPGETADQFLARRMVNEIRDKAAKTPGLTQY